jgi:hypothetical protein
MLAARVDEYGKAGWIAATVLGFVLWWPVGLAMLIFAICSGRLRRCGWRGDMPGRWHNMDGGCGWGPFGGRGRGRWGGGSGGGGPSGNQAFDDYRAETLRRLEQEQQEFRDYLERLRRAKDKAEFDQFMADRRSGRPAGMPPGETV